MRGHVASNDVLSNFYNSADILVITSKEEGVPRALYESISYGTPVIALLCLELRVFLMIYICWFDDIEIDLAEQIIRLLTSRRDYDAMSRKVKQLYLNFLRNH